MRCQDCSKFVSFGEPEAEIHSSEVEDGVLSAEITIYRTCADCGAQLMQASVSFEQDIDHTCRDETKHPLEEDAKEFTIESEEVEFTEESIREVSADLSFRLKCNQCDLDDIEVSGTVSEIKSAFEEVG